MLQTVEQLTSKYPAWSIIWLHGLGADGNDFAPIVPELVRDGWPGIRFVFPHAPVRPVTINGGVPMRAWYDIDPRSPLSGTEDIRASADAIAALVAREVARGVPPRRITLAGFSQGGVIALALGLRHPDRLAGITIEFNLEGLLRGDSAARASFYQQMLSNGVMTINEVRALENLPPVEGGDVPRMQMQNVPITQTGSGAAPAALPPLDPGATP